jgi:hypothetical protein
VRVSASSGSEPLTFILSPVGERRVAFGVFSNQLLGLIEIFSASKKLPLD